MFAFQKTQGHFLTVSSRICYDAIGYLPGKEMNMVRKTKMETVTRGEIDIDMLSHEEQSAFYSTLLAQIAKIASKENGGHSRERPNNENETCLSFAGG